MNDGGAGVAWALASPARSGGSASGVGVGAVVLLAHYTRLSPQRRMPTGKSNGVHGARWRPGQCR